MNLLAVDTSGPVAGVAVLKDGEVAYEGAAVNRLTHSVNLMPMIEEALGRAGLDVSEIGLYAAVTGPGSFTGVRIGVSAVKGMAHGAGKPCVGVDALEALAAAVPPFPSRNNSPPQDPSPKCAAASLLRRCRTCYPHSDPRRR